MICAAHCSIGMILVLTSLFDRYPLQPAVNGLATEAPVPPDFLRGDLALLGKLVERGSGDSQVGQHFLERHHIVWLLVHRLPQWRKAALRSLILNDADYTKYC